ncbi:PAAR-like domain-containing protein [uncultured Paracoccus sp.]|uniref:PAAR-like domain-containing protein n=1 Tax=uncultured Paracoccus sp. TaxID=189685 RepID=UPI002637D3EA|nr:PAAR-like domain-containing protein [uncultured Paracoccus sp.]
MSIPRDQIGDNYIGEPDYPAPWTTSTPREGLRDTDEAGIISLAPDVCRSPGTPVPYPVVDFCGHDENYTSSVRFTGQKAMVMRSNTSHVHDDEPGIGKGVKSNTVGGISEPITHAAQVRAEGSHVIRHLDRFWMNNRNTVGEAVFVRDTKTYTAPEDDDPLPGSIRLADASGSCAQFAGPAPAERIPAPRQVPVPKPGPTPRPVPGKPGGTVIRPSPERTPNWQWESKPDPKGRGLERLGKFGRFIGRRSLPLALVWPEPLADGTIRVWDQFTPQDDYETWLVEEASRRCRYEGVPRKEVEEDFQYQLENHRKSNPVASDQEKPQALPATDQVRVSRPRRDFKCLVGPYATVRPACPGEAHHIVPDFVLRYGNRLEGVAGTKRIPKAPSFAGGMTICLVQAEHLGVHGPLNEAIKRLGWHPAKVQGTAPIARVLVEAERSIDRMPIPTDCKAKAKALTRVQMAPILAAPGRTTMTLPFPDAVRVLQRGYY